MKFNIFLLGILVATCTFFFSGNSYGQESKPPAEVISPVTTTQNQSSTVEIKAKLGAEKAIDDTTSKTVVSNAELMRYGDAKIMDAMKRIPGIIVKRNEVQLSGMTAAYTQILIDGEPLRNISINDIPINTIDRIEIYRLASAEFSSQGIAGTINIISKRVPRESQQKLKVTLTNTQSFSENVEWFLSDKADNLSYSLSISGVAGNDIADIPVRTSFYVLDKDDQILQYFKTTDTTRSKQYSLRINPVLQYRGEGELQLRSSTFVRFYQNHWQNNSYFDYINGSTLPIGQTYIDTKADTKSLNTSLKVTDTIWNDAKLEFNIGISALENKINPKEYNFDSASNLAYDRISMFHKRSGELNSSGKLQLPSNGAHDIVAGWSGSRKHTNNERISLDSGAMAVSDKPIIQNVHSIINKLSFFIQDEWRFQRESSAYFGLRKEIVQLESAGTQQEKVRNESHVWSPIVETLWQLNTEKTDRLRLGVSRSYKTPVESYLISPIYSNAISTLEKPNFKGNPNLKPELAWSMVAAYEHSGADRLNYSVRAEVRKIEDLNRQYLSKIGNDWWLQFENFGQALSKSISLESSMPLMRLISDAPNVNFSFALSKYWTSVSSVPKPDNRLSPNSLKISSSVDYTAKVLPISLGLSLRYLDAKPMQSNLNKREESQSETMIDLYATWKFSEKTKLNLGLDNFFRHTAFNRNFYFADDLTTVQIYPERTYRTVRLNFEHSF